MMTFARSLRLHWQSLLIHRKYERYESGFSKIDSTVLSMTTAQTAPAPAPTTEDSNRNEINTYRHHFYNLEARRSCNPSDHQMSHSQVEMLSRI